MAQKIKRFRLKPDADVSSIQQDPFMTYVHKDAIRGFWHTLKDDITINIVFPKNLSEWNDFDYILVLDEEFCQPYTPFYAFMDDPKRGSFPYLGEVVKAYNEFMASLPYLEEVV